MFSLLYLHLNDEGKYIAQNEAHKKLLGYLNEDIKGKTPEIHLGEKLEKILDDINKKGYFSGEIQSLTKDGRFLTLWLNAYQIEANGKKYYIGIKQDISKIKELGDIYSNVISNSPISIAVFGEKFKFVNENFLSLIGYKKDSLKNIHLWELVSEEYKEVLKDITKEIVRGKFENPLHIVLPIKGKDGTTKWTYSTISPIKYKNENAGLITLIDITHQKELEDRLYELENFDLTTGLANKQLFKQELNYILKEAQKENDEVGIILFDIYNFTDINDTMGSSVGDEILKEVANRLRDCIFETDLIARYGSDEFVIAVRKYKSQERFSSYILSKIRDCLAKPFHIKNEEIHLDFNFGVAFFPYDGKDADELISNVELALKEAKKKGRGEIFIFNKEINKNFRKHIILINDLKNAIKNREFDVYFQPKIELQTGRVVGAEALARWKVSPAEFIPALVEANLMFDAGCIITEKTLKYASQIIREFPDLKISINMSFEQLKFDNCPTKLYGLSCQNEVKPESIIVEITETETMKNPDIHLSRLNNVKELGYTISIDDFGTGYSSLNYLKLIPASEIKIDRSFIKDIFNDENDAELVKIIIQIAKMMNMKVVAEGVETKAQAEILRILGCDYAQGFYFAKPMPFDDFMAYLKQQ
ncbi:MAG: hypothetical protein DSY47_07095 [Hydrogenothermus sp.]|nr:MAG: hypothetical protein DSY47_07095 [Hydrogenothermus sp.]